ncbi:TPA: hypothetical protein N0F65_005330 [Lagenidium giganteum]|uniref:Altered inheritance of mitochondria protein 24, mitochondrial n=1 Tax=Lagenidium giganteum TaxID=4803 RepID=A0AAV2YYD6_9STRA|nr:TPA: hypothetical protein N0F65_005330 [Lagenidium giganteum]
MMTLRLLAAASHRREPLRLARAFSSSLPEGWERVVRRNGSVVYSNAALRKTVRHLPGVEPEHVAPPSTRKEVSSAAKADEQQRESPTAYDTVQTTTTPDDQVFVPINFDEAMRIEGHESQIVHLELKPQQRLRAETGAMIYMTEGVDMDTTTAGGFQQGVRRVLTGENFFVTRFTYNGTSKGYVGLGTSFPSKIVRFRMSDFIGNSVICQKGAFLCGSDTIEINMEFAKKFGVGFFGGEGFILQRLSGEGDALVRACGTLVERDLQPGEVLRISSGCLVAFEPTVHYDITTMKGFKNIVFGGEGLFVTTLTGPGKVFLQSLPFDRVYGEIVSRVPTGGPGGMMFPFMMGGGGGGDGGASGGVGDASAGAAAGVAGADAAESEALGQDEDWKAPEEDAGIYGGNDQPDSSQMDASDSKELLDDEAAAEGVGESVQGVMDFFDNPLFVTWEIEHDGGVDLRGCIGTLSPTKLQNLRDFTFKSALRDRRFDPIQPKDFQRLHCSVSLLIDYEDAEHYEDWEIGVHGIIIEFEDASGNEYSATYLPDVASQQGWNHLETVTSLIRKAGFRRSVTSSMLKAVKVTRYRSSKHKLTYQEYLAHKQAAKHESTPQ